MAGKVEYDDWADIYDIWVESAPVTRENLAFYVREYLNTSGPAVELGVGNGRILVEAAQQGKAMTGVDYSAQMLELCRRQAATAGVLDRLTLIQGDFRDFVLPEPAELITIPFHTIGHLVSLEDKRDGLRHIWSQLAPGGRLIFDHFVFDPESVRRHSHLALRAETTDPTTGRDVLLWTINRYDMDAQSIRIIAFTDELDGDGVLLQRRYRRAGFSWIEPEQARALLEGTGYRIEALYGDFQGGAFTAESPRQVWVARRPA